MKLSKIVLTLLIAGLSPLAWSQTSNLYVSSNEHENRVIHYARQANGELVEVERVPTGRKALGGFKPISGEASAPDGLVSDSALKLSADHKWLFVVNAGDNSVSSFKVADDGRLTVVDSQPSGEAMPNSVAFDEKTNKLYVLHLFGPKHISTFDVANGMLKRTGRSYTLNYGELKNKSGMQLLLSPDHKYLIAISLYSEILRDATGKAIKVVPANAKAPDGLTIFAIGKDGELGAPKLASAGGATPFGTRFLHGSNRFVTTLDESSELALNMLNEDGSVSNLSKAQVALVPIKGDAGSCWVAVSPDDKYAYATNFNAGTISSFRIEGNTVSLAYDGMGRVPGNGKYRSEGTLTSGPVGSWSSPDGYFYQLYPNASKLVAYRLSGPEIIRIGDYPIPLDSPQGIDGF